MVPTTKKKCSYSPSKMKTAVEAVIAGAKLRPTAVLYGVPVMSLYDCVKRNKTNLQSSTKKKCLYSCGKMKTAVEAVIAGEKLRSTAVLYGVPVTSLSNCVKRYRIDYKLPAKNKCSYSPSKMKAAVEAVIAGAKLRPTAVLYGVPVMSLSDRVKRSRTDKNPKIAKKPILTPEPESGKKEHALKVSNNPEGFPTKKKCSYSPNKMKAAVEAVIAGAKLRPTAALYSVPVMSLSDHVKHHGTDYQPRLGKKPVFTPHQESEIREHALKLSNSSHGLTTEELKRIVFEYAESNNIKNPFNKNKKTAGKDWLHGFLSRHPDINIRRPETVTFKRIVEMNQDQLEKILTIS